MLLFNLLAAILLSVSTFCDVNENKSEASIGGRLDIDCGSKFIEVTRAQWTYKDGWGPSRLLEAAKLMPRKVLSETEVYKFKCDNLQKYGVSDVVPAEPQLQHITQGLKLVVLFKCWAGACPNDTYKQKHIVPAEYASNLEEFAAYADEQRENNGWETTNKITVFTDAEGMTYQRDPKYETKCMAQHAARMYQCRRKYNNWECEADGEEIASHDTLTGHYDNEEPSESALRRVKTV